MVFSRTQIDRLASACIAIGDAAADEDGFVRIRSLLERFDVSLVMRPLLVEAMLCEASVESQSPGSHRWTMLIDSDLYPLGEDALEREMLGSPLPHRFRNTVAHELAHSLTFRAGEFGVRLMLATDSRARTLTQEVEEIERHIESLSPLLLLPSISVERKLSPTSPRLSVDDLIEFRRNFGISRFLLVNRLNLLKSFGDGEVLLRDCIRNVAVGVGEWKRGGKPVLLGWPLFTNFNRNVVPGFLHSLRRQKRLNGDSLIGDHAFVFNGGRCTVTRLRVRGGTELNPESEELEVQFAVETPRSRASQTFLFVVSST